MRVFCPVHNKRFSVPRRNPIHCENKGHVLAELHFDGRAKKVVETSWEYCCNCEHFWPSESAHEQCPVCNREISTRYPCRPCFTFTLESFTGVPVKNFTLTAAGAPKPTCPACLQGAPDEAFKALVVAAQRATNSGTAQRMLSELMADKDTYFRKTSPGHGEWNF